MMDEENEMNHIQQNGDVVGSPNNITPTKEDETVLGNTQTSAATAGASMHNHDQPALSSSPYKITRHTYTQSAFDDLCGVDNGNIPNVPHSDIPSPMVVSPNVNSHSHSFHARLRTLFIKRCSCSMACWKAAIFGMLPVVKWLKEYDIKENIIPDILAGLTVAVMNIPQGMAYSLLANVDAVYGLYVSFFPVLVYFIMGTSRHISLGTFAVISLMVGNIVNDYADNNPPAILRFTNNETTRSNATMITSIGSQSEGILDGVGVTVAVALMVGLLQVIMGVMRLGFVTMYMSAEMVSAFTCGAAVHVLSSQIKHLFGITVSRYQPPFNLVYAYVEMVPKIFSETNISALVISIVSIILMVFVKIFISDRFKAKCRMPFPIELIVVIVGTGVSYGADLAGNYHTKIIGRIPTGLPSPTPPNITPVIDKIGDCFAIAVVAFVVTISMSNLFAKKHSYEVDANQELIALGSANIFGSFFSSFPSCASLSRSLVQEGAGGRTQIASLVSAILILIVLLAIGPLFESLPNAILASIIVVNLRGMFMQLRQLKMLWHADLLDFLIWLVTFISTVLLDVVYGLMVGVGFSLLTVVFRTQSPNAYLLGRVGNTNIYRGVKKYKCAQEIAGIKIFRFEAALYFANTEFFKNRLFRLTGLNPNSLICKQHKVGERLRRLERRRSSIVAGAMHSLHSRLPVHSTTGAVTGVTGVTAAPDDSYEVPLGPNDVTMESLDGGTTGNPNPDRPRIRHGSDAPDSIIGRHVDMEKKSRVSLSSGRGEGNQFVGGDTQVIIIDCSMFGYVDTVGTKALLQLIKDYEVIGIVVYLVACQEGLLLNLADQKFFDSAPEDALHLSIHDAVLYVEQLRRAGEELVQAGELCPQHSD